MCPSILCPSCGQQTYHHGACENERCRYKPYLEAHQVLGIDFAFVAFVNGSPVHWQKILKPFKRIVFWSESRAAVEDLARKIGYDGPYFRTPKDPDNFLSEERWGFEFAKRAADELEPQYDRLLAGL